MAQILFQDYVDAKAKVATMWNEVFGITLNWNSFASSTTANGARAESSKASSVTTFPNEHTNTLINPLNQGNRFKPIVDANTNKQITAEAVNALYNLVEIAKEEAYRGAGYGADLSAHYTANDASKYSTVKSSQYSGYDSYNSGYHSGWCTSRNQDKHSPRY